jgi:hypothetical protein
VQSYYVWPLAAFVALAVLSAAADWRGHRRREADRAAGRMALVPWPLVMLLALIAAVFCAALWLHDG